MGPPPLAKLRVAARLANGFALDLVKLGGTGDIVDRLLGAAISQANVAQITRSAELQLRYATFDAIPPDEERRPVSINAIASSLRIPFETTRRRVAALAEVGVLQVVPRGVIVPNGPLTTPQYRQMVFANYELVRSLYARLRGVGVVDDLAHAPSRFDPSDPPVRLVIRLSTDYLLRLAEPVTQHIGDVIMGLVLMDVILANTEHVPDIEPPEMIAPEGHVRDELRRPVRAAALAERLGVPLETVRRRLAKLVETDRCERRADGYVVPGRVLGREPFVQYMVANRTHVQRLFQGLADHGVLALWDEPAGLRGAA
jgi:hypothetical protein